MTREELVAMIYEDNTYRSCQPEEIKCELEDAEINTQEYCKKCAEKLLTEYEDKIRADEIDKRASLLAFICKKYDISLVDMNCTVDEWEELKEQKWASHKS